MLSIQLPNVAFRKILILHNALLLHLENPGNDSPKVRKHSAEPSSYELLNSAVKFAITVKESFEH